MIFDPALTTGHTGPYHGGSLVIYDAQATMVNDNYFFPWVSVIVASQQWIKSGG